MKVQFYFDGPLGWIKPQRMPQPSPLQALYGGGGDWCYCVAVPPTLKACGTKLLGCFEATTLLYQFAAETALSVIHLWEAPAVVRECLELRDKAHGQMVTDAEVESYYVMLRTKWSNDRITEFKYQAARAAWWACDSDRGIGVHSTVRNTVIATDYALPGLNLDDRLRQLLLNKLTLQTGETNEKNQKTDRNYTCGAV